ncbi:hypothetical protein NG701_17005 [Pseudarthrobacter sp. HLT3-5]|uniref:hypothetical protein n=1 Tax=Pseudarthrobacter cellobiosi TaxID=2953654 RepID=UPI00208FB651|nr:hypothetical protein [Pseudarthrobacter sp. HLT3-5]MCO4276102.1 hypothetical protein [Pseudarthrobacter sp. HLT3-5]
MSADDVCPPLYVPTRSECNAMKEQSKAFLIGAGLSPLKWQLDAMGCSCRSHIEDVPAPTSPGEAA